MDLDPSSIDPILHAMKKHNLSALVLTETKLYGRAVPIPPFRHHYRGITYSVHLGPYVGLITTDSVYITSIRQGSSQRTLSAILCLHHQTKDIQLLGVYCPPASARGGVTPVEVLEELEELRRPHRYKELLLAGDFNARVGFPQDTDLSPSIGPFRGSSLNESSEAFATFLLENDLRLPVTFSQRNWSTVWTWMNPNPNARHRRQQLDHFVCSPALLPLIKSTRAYSSNLVSTDHRLLILTLRLPIRTAYRERHHQARTTRAVINTPEFLENLRLRLSVTVLPPSAPYEAAAPIIATAAREAAACAPPTREQRTDSTLIQSRLRKLLRDNPRPRPRAAHEEINRQRNLLSHSRRRRRRQQFRRITNAMNQAQARGDSKALYHNLRLLPGCARQPSRFTPIRFGAATANTPEEASEMYAAHLQAIFTSTPDNSPLFQFPRTTRSSTATAARSGISPLPPTDAEILEAVTCIRNGRMAGPDSIYAEYLRLEDLHPWLTQWIRSVWTSGTVPSSIAAAQVLMLLKKGRPRSDSTSYRPISVTNSICKLLEKLICFRLTPLLEQVSCWQSGFRANRQASENVTLLRLLQEEARRLAEPVYVLYIDLKSAYDLVDRQRLYWILHERGCPHPILKLIKNLLDCYNYQVRSGTSLSAQYPTSRGLAQGGALSPTLFSLFLDAAMQTVTRRFESLSASSIRLPFVPDRNVPYLGFADDLIFLGSNQDALVRRLEIAAEIFATYGITVSIPKCSWQCLHDPRGTPSPCDLLSSLGAIQHSTTTKYLGVVIPECGKVAINMDARLAAGACSVWSIKHLLRNKQFSARLRYNVFRAKAMASVLYGIECSQMPATELQKLNKFHARHIRLILGLPRNDRTPLKTLLPLIGEDLSMGQTGLLRRTNFCFHLLRHDSPLGMALQGSITSPPRQLSKKTWLYEVLTELNRAASYARTTIWDLAQQRTRQKRVSRTVVKHGGTLGLLECTLCGDSYKCQGWLLRHIFHKHVLTYIAA